MCGLHGYVNGKARNTTADDFLANGFIAGSLRGTDASGIASVNAKGQVFWQKLPVSGPMFIGDKYTKSLMKDAMEPHSISICHTRSATVGGSEGINGAHPFLIDCDEAGVREMIGAHNGTLTSWHNKKGAAKFKVDSEWALNHIYDEGIGAFKEFIGSYCFVWWDSNESKVLNIALNKERPMCVVFTKDGGMAYASEPGMLYWLCERNNIQMDGPVLRLDADRWYKFHSEKLREFTSESLPAIPVKAVVTTYHGTNFTRYARDSKSVVEKITTLLELIGNKATSKASTSMVVLPTVKEFNPTFSVTKEEVLQAKEWQLLGKRGVFKPSYLDKSNNEVVGVFIQTDVMEFPAVIRNAEKLEYGPATEWEVSCIGMNDDGFDFVAICSKPRISSVSKQVASSPQLSTPTSIH